MMAVLLFGFYNKGWSQESKELQGVFRQADKDKLFIPVMNIEAWATYSINECQGEVQYVDRNDTEFRRVRMGAKGQPYWWLGYAFELQLDRLGENGYSSTKGSYSGIDIWTGYLTLRLSKKSEWLNFHAGYYWAAISRQFNTSPWAVSAFDKTRACWYMRSFITGRGNGIESGFGFGGLKNFRNVGISYRIGMYEPDAFECANTSSRLLTGRLMLSIGDPEQSHYSYMLSGNQWRERRGITIGLGGSGQNRGCLNEVVEFSQSRAWGGDVVVDWKGFHLDGEYFMFRRIASDYKDFKGCEYHISMSYNFIFRKKYLEPCITYDCYEGQGAAELFNHIGLDETWDAGINWYVNKDKLKLSLHYIIQHGSVASNVGDYMGVALQFRL